MNNLRFQVWIRRAVSRIVLTQDRIRAGRELLDHMEDNYQEHLDRGMEPRDAEAWTLAAMGDADTVARQLGIIHRPFWGYCQKYSHRILVVIACLALVCLCGRIIAGLFFTDGYEQPAYVRYDPYRDSSAHDGVSKLERTFYSQPGDTVTSDGYILTLTEAALWHSAYTDTAGQPREQDRLHFRIRVTNPMPWAEHDDISRRFWAVDDLGNYYCASYEAAPGIPSVQSSIYHTGPLTYLHDLYLTDYASQDAQWIELHYDRAGRDLVLRIDLTGGDTV